MLRHHSLVSGWPLVALLTGSCLAPPALLAQAPQAPARTPLVGPNGISASPSRPAGVVNVPQALVTAIDDIQVPAREAGALSRLNVKGGELIEAGAIIGELDNRDSLARMKIAQAEFSAAKAQAESSAEVDAAVKASEVAKAEWDQLEDLRRKNPGAVSLTELRRASFQYERALAQIAVAKNDKVVAGHNAEAKTAQMGAIDVELERRKVLSPLNGQVIEVLKHNGEWCTPGESVVRVLRLDRLRIEGFVFASEASPGDVLGKPVDVIVFLPGAKPRQERLSGVIEFASPVIEGSGQYRSFRVWTEVENRFINGFWTLQPGASAVMDINTNAPAAAIRTAPAVVPAASGAPAPFRASVGDAPVLGNPAAPGAPQPFNPAAPLQETRKPELNEPAPAAQPADSKPVLPPPPAPLAPKTTAPPPTQPPAAKGPAASRLFQPTLPRVK